MSAIDDALEANQMFAQTFNSDLGVRRRHGS